VIELAGRELPALLVLLALTANLDGDEHHDHVHDQPDPEERGEQTYVLAEGCA
jgi:hypothetical protein